MNLSGGTTAFVADALSFREDVNTFERFTPIVKIDLRPVPGNDWFEMLAPFKLGPDGDGIAPLTEAVTIQTGTLSKTIPARSFKLKNGLFTFNGVIDGAELYV